VRDGLSNSMLAGERSYTSAGIGVRVQTPFWGIGAYNAPIALNNMSINQQNLTFGVEGPNGYWSFSSLHEGGAFVAFGDGAVRFLSENMDRTIFRSLATIAGNELIDDEDY